MKMKTFYSPLTRNEEEFFNHITYVIDILTNPKIPEFTEDCNFCSFASQQIGVL